MKKDNENIDTLVFSGSIVYQNGRYALMLRSFVYDKKDIGKIVNEIINKKEFRFKGILIFRNPQLSVLRLKELGLI